MFLQQPIVLNLSSKLFPENKFAFLSLLVLCTLKIHCALLI